jgi:sulfate permease, SulP family
MKRFGRPDVSALSLDVLSGGIGGIVQIAYCISFSALIFQGPLASGFALGLAALIMGTIVTSAVVALTTTLNPAIAGPDTPTVAVMSVLAGSVAAALAAQHASQETIIINVLVALSVSTLLCGVFLYALGFFHLGQLLRFVPYPVIGGFLAASGWLLITGGIQVVTGVNMTVAPSTWVASFAPQYLPQLGVALLFALAIVGFQRIVPSFLSLPLAFGGFLAVMDVALFGFVPKSEAATWFLAGVGHVTPWWPIPAAMRHHIDWMAMAKSGAEFGAVCGITAISMLLDISSLEVARQKTADLDSELRTNGIANFLASVVGGIAGNLSMNGAVLITEAGGSTRFAGVVVALICAIVLFCGVDVGSIVPKAVLGGMLAYLGWIILLEVLAHSPAQGSKAEIALGAAIMIVICYSGYLLGVVLGVIGACLVFALNYSRIGVVRRHLTRREFSGNVERSPEQTRLLEEHGAGIHIFWLSGFIFFGSSNGLFERLRRTIDEQKTPVRFIVLDFSAVSGLDTSAVLSLVKLRNYCDEHDVSLVFSGLDKPTKDNFARAGFFASNALHKTFDSRNEALEWCEERLLRPHDLQASERSFEGWLRSELGELVDIDRISPYLEKCALAEGDFIFRQGDAADSLGMIAEGCVAITIEDELGRPIRLRRMAGQTVVGEMGFYRGLPRTANVVAEEPTLIYLLSRAGFERMRQQDPEAASAFNQLIIRLLADRLSFANREISALL